VEPRQKQKGDSKMSDQQLILAFFADEAAADAAVKGLKSWDKATETVKLGAIGVLAKDAKGNVKTDKLGKRAGKKGAGVGVVLGIIAAVPTGGLSLLAGTAWGAVGGGIIGSFFHKGLGLSKDDMERIGKALDGGKAAIGLLVNSDEVEAVNAKLAELGGTPEVHEVDEAALQQAAQVADATPEVAPTGDAAGDAPAADATPKE
jgi:uncharacterized membrane protein